MNFELAVPDRVQLLNLSMEIEGNVTTLKEIRAFQDAIGFTDEELQGLGFTQDGTKVTWSGVADDITVDVTITVRDTIGGLLKRLSEENKLRAEHLPLYEKFCEDL
ncbi:MAG: hypothetical protein ACYTBZ_27790 [Planctomycetota bacterium]|jgi:hypothetical protein